jgi:hypothetical protein
MSKSYWVVVTTRTDRQQQAMLSWFNGMCDGMKIESAEVLCDKETDREKKIKAVVVDTDGRRHVATRTLGGKTYTVSLSPMGKD